MALSTTNKLFLSAIAIGTLVLTARSFQSKQLSGRHVQSSADFPSNGAANRALLTVWAWSTPAESLRIIAKEFEHLNPLVNVRVDMLGSNMSRARFLLALSAGVGAPDVAMIEIQNVEQYAATGTLADLTPHAKQYESSFPSSSWNNCVYEGKVYGIPWDLGPCGVFYKSALFKKYGIDAKDIKTWDDYIEAGKQIVERSDGQTRMLPLSIGEMAHLFEMLLHQAGGQVFDDQGRIAINCFAARESLRVIRRMIQEGISANIAPHGYEMYASFNNESIASHPMPVWFGGMIKDVADASLASTLQWDVFQLPAIQSGGLRNSSRGGSVLVIPAQSKHFEDAWQFVEYSLCRVESQLQHYQEFNLFPAYLPALEDGRFDQADSFFSGRHVALLFSQQLDEIPTLHRTSDWLRAESYLNQSLGRWGTGEMEIDDFLRRLAKKLARRTGREVAPLSVVEKGPVTEPTAGKRHP